MSNKLVAYFSASGVTKKVAEKLAKATGADLFEIVPEVPYTKADLNWMNKNSWSSVEMNDTSCRLGIATSVENMDQYDTVFIGFPIWWYREPSIIDTFMESYDFTSKTVVPFCTSGSSGIGDSGANIQAFASGAKVGIGERFSKRVSENELAAWASSFEQY